MILIDSVNGAILKLGVKEVLEPCWTSFKTLLVIFAALGKLLLSTSIRAALLRTNIVASSFKYRRYTLEGLPAEIWS